jgi:hypothetical protein
MLSYLGEKTANAKSGRKHINGSITLTNNLIGAPSMAHMLPALCISL